MAAASFAVLAVTVLTVRAGGGEVAAAPGLAVYDACKPVDAIWVRGSGQVVSQSVSAENWTNQYRRFRSELERRLGDETVHFYELGFEPITGYQYPAEAVGTGDWDAISSSLGALFSGGQSYEYGASVDQGVGELSMYVKLRLITCPDTLFVVGGYSQGAQVAGEAYVEELTPLERSAVVFTMLFGDPKLYLPEGSVDWADWHDDEHSNTPPACQGRGLSEWRRGVPNCRTNAGSLGSRVPYLPASWSDTTGLWCADRDFICGSASAPWTLDGHMAYSQSGAIDEGVREAVERLQARMPGSTFNTKWLTVKQGAVGLDVVFVVDSTGSMTSRIAAARALASTLAGDVVGRSGRVALVEYRDAGDRFTARVLTQLAADDSDFTRALNGIRVGGGGDAPEALLHALKTAMEGVDWTPGATKAIVVLTDAGFHSPDRVDGTTLAQVAALSLSIDPVNVYPVVPASLASAYAELAEATTGQVVADTGDTAEALLEALTRVIDRPVARLPLNTYEAAPGDEVFFDGSSSYSVDSEIAAWDWDFDGDGVYEVTDGGSTASYVYEDRFDGFMQMRVWDAAGLVASTSVRVLVGADAVASEDEPRDLTAEVDGYTATVSWTTAQDPPSAWRVTLNGVELGYAPPEARSVGLTDLAWDGPNLVGITPLYAEVGLGETALID
ncbi:MAG: cutinase family protein, partial [Bifidobacteriaceae bacterium]|nr:cutinase family protein [Bifidobacteriaceae bacterium]